jgi:hypothetical protein
MTKKKKKIYRAGMMPEPYEDVIWEKAHVKFTPPIPKPKTKKTKTPK